MWHSTTTIFPSTDDYDSELASKAGTEAGPDEELQPTILPYACLPPLHLISGEPLVLPRGLANVQYLYENGIIHWPNFTVITNVTTAVDTVDDYCLPNCGLCTTHTGDFTYSVFNLLIIGTLLPLVGVAGVFGNSLSAYVYSRAGMRRHSTNLYLCALGCSDNAVILTALFLFFVDSIKRHSAALSVIYGRLSPVIYPAGMIAQTCSVYFTLVAGVDYFVQVCTSGELRRCFASPRFARAAIIGTVVFSVIYNVPHCFEAILVDCWHVAFCSRSVEVCPAPFRFNQTYTAIYYKYMYSIFLAVGPLLILIVLNSCIILVTLYNTKKHCRKSSSRHHNNHIVDCTEPTEKAKQQRCCCSRNGSIKPILKTASVESDAPPAAAAVRNVLFDEVCTSTGAPPSSDDNMALILVVLLFIACNMVALLINVFEQRLSALLEWRINYIIDVSNLLVVFNSSFNIIIYYNFSMAYRETFNEELLAGWRRRRQRRENCALNGAPECAIANENSRTELLSCGDASLEANGGASLFNATPGYCNGACRPIGATLSLLRDVNDAPPDEVPYSVRSVIHVCDYDDDVLVDASVELEYGSPAGSPAIWQLSTDRSIVN